MYSFETTGSGVAAGRTPPMDTSCNFLDLDAFDDVFQTVDLPVDTACTWSTPSLSALRTSACLSRPNQEVRWRFGALPSKQLQCRSYGVMHAAQPHTAPLTTSPVLQAGCDVLSPSLTAELPLLRTPLRSPPLQTKYCGLSCAASPPRAIPPCEHLEYPVQHSVSYRNPPCVVGAHTTTMPDPTTAVVQPSDPALGGPMWPDGFLPARLSDAEPADLLSLQQQIEASATPVPLILRQDPIALLDGTFPCQDYSASHNTARDPTVSNNLKVQAG